MLVSHRKQFIYTKTVKTAGTSVEVYFEPYCLPENSQVGCQYPQETYDLPREEYVGESGIIGYRGHKFPDSKHHDWFNHMPASKIREQIGQTIWEKYFKFCVIRNPFDKLISLFHFYEYQFNQVNPQIKAWAIKRLKYDSEDDYLEALTNQSVEKRFRNWIIRGGFVIDRDKYLIDNQICVDYFIRYENLHNDLQHICKQLDVPFEPDRLARLKPGNRPSHLVVSQYYDQPTTEIVLRNYRFELEFFEYTPPTKFSNRILFALKDSDSQKTEQIESLELQVRSLKGEIEGLRNDLKNYQRLSEQALSRIEKMKDKLSRSRHRFRQSKNLLKRKKQEINILKANLEEIEDREFWELRSFWFRFRQIFLKNKGRKN